MITKGKLEKFVHQLDLRGASSMFTFMTILGEFGVA